MQSKFSEYMSDMIPKIGNLHRAVLKYIDKSEPIHYETLPEIPSREITAIVNNYFQLRQILVQMNEIYKDVNLFENSKLELLASEYDKFNRSYESVLACDTIIKDHYHRYWDTQIDLL